MKKLYIVRHAKSSWKDVTLADYDRPLNKRGKKDAPFMGEALKKQGIVPNLIIASSAKRAKKTATALATILEYPKEEILFDKKIYSEGMRRILKIIAQQPERLPSLMIVGHNPDVTLLAEILSGISIDNIPTAGIFALEFDTHSWRHISPGSGNMLFFDYPKKHNR